MACTGYLKSRILIWTALAILYASKSEYYGMLFSAVFFAVFRKNISKYCVTLSPEDGIMVRILAVRRMFTCKKISACYFPRGICNSFLVSFRFFCLSDLLRFSAAGAQDRCHLQLTTMGAIYRNQIHHLVGEPA